MAEQLRNGRPRIVDQNGNPFIRDAIPDGSAAPGADGIAVPPGWLFVAKYGGAYNTLWQDRFDEALRHARSDAEAMRHDCYLMSLLQERQLAFVNLPWHLEVPDEKDPYQVQVRDGITRLIKAIPNLRRILYWLSEAIWYGRFGVQVAWDWAEFDDRPVHPPKEEEEQLQQQTPDQRGMIQAARRGDRVARYALADHFEEQGQQLVADRVRSGGRIPGDHKRRGFSVKEAWPVNGDKIGHQYDHTPYVLIYSGDTDELKDASIISTTLGRALSLRGTWRERFIIHKHLQQDVDYFAPEQAEAIHGVGIRSGLFWIDWLKRQLLGDVVDFYDRVGLGVTVWKYARGNKEALKAVQQAARDQSNRAHIFVPVDPDDMHKQGAGVERLEVPISGADALGKLIEMCDAWIERYVVGQEASSGASASGLGNEENAKFQRNTKRAITELDANLLAETLTGSDREPGLVNTILRYTYRDADFPVSWVFDLESGESKEKLDAIKTVVDLGVDCKADEVRKAAGLSKPAEGDELVKGKKEEQQGQGGPPGAGGADPMAALMGGGGEQPAQEQVPEQEPVAQGGGDFLDALRQMKESIEALRYERDTPESQPEAEPEIPSSNLVSYARLLAAVQHLRDRGRDDMAGELLAAAGRRNALHHKADWEEGKHPRGRGGKFASRSEHDTEESTNSDSELVRKPDHASKLVSLFRQLPGKVAALAKRKVQEKFAQLVNRYGKKWAVAILSAGVAGSVGLPIIPGSGLVAAAPLLAAAEMARLFRSKPAEEPMQHSRDPENELTEDEIQLLGEQFIQELMEEWKGEGYGDDNE